MLRRHSFIALVSAPLRAAASLLVPVALVALPACGSSTNPSDNLIDSGTTTSSGGDGGVSTPTNTAFCPSGGPTLASSCNGLDVCNVCVAKPSAEASRTSDTREYAGTGPVDTSCLVDGAMARTLDTAHSKMVKFTGWVEVFANGNDTSDVKIEIYKYAAGGALGDLVGAAVVTGKCSMTGTTAPCNNLKVVTKDPGGGNPTYQQFDLPYEYDGVPTETQLIVKTSSGSASAGWFPLYDYNIVARNAALNADGTFSYEARALGDADYGAILRAAYARAPESGQSAIAGEVHDCGDVRIANATVGVGPSAGAGLFYLSSNEDNPLPDNALKATARVGLYAAGGITPGSYRVAAAGQVGGKDYGMGAFDIQTFPDSVSAITFRGAAWH